MSIRFFLYALTEVIIAVTMPRKMNININMPYCVLVDDKERVDFECQEYNI